MVLCIMFYFGGPHEVLVFNLFAAFMWCIGFTGTVVWLRECFHRQHWAGLRFWPLIIKAFFPILLAGFATTVFMVITSLPPFIDDITNYRMREEPELTQLDFAIGFFLRNWFQSSFHIGAWFGAYLSITSSRRVKDAQIANLKLQSSLKEAQLSNLASQLNPHFLFNALNNIRFMINENGAQAERVLVALSDVLRYALQSRESEQVSLTQEVEVIEKYAEIIKIQFEDKMRFSMSVPRELSGQSVPPMILQMLLENAVKHGLERLPEGADINLDVFQRGANLVIRMCNDVPNVELANTSSTGIGLRNIRQRLFLIYGEQATVETHMMKQQFCVDISLPLASATLANSVIDDKVPVPV